MINFHQVFEGWRNNILPPEEMKEAIASVSVERMEVCKGCSFYSENKKKEGWAILRLDIHCTKCGCTLSAKTKCMSCSCPIGFWKEVISQKDEELIQNEQQLKD